MSTEGLVYSHKIPLDEFCRNLIGARAYAAQYFDSQVLFVSSAPELVCLVVDAHPYLDAHMDTLNDFGLSDSCYGLALHGRVAHIVNLIPTVSRQQEWTRWRLKMEEFNWDKLEFDVSHCLPGEEEYTANASHCIAENDLHPFRMHSLPAPHCPQVAASSAKIPARPRPTMIRQPKAAREPAIPPASSLKVEVRMPPSSSVTVGSSTAHKRQRAPDPTTPPSINLTQVKWLSKTAQPAPPSLDVKATRPIPLSLPCRPPPLRRNRGLELYISDDVVESESGGEGGVTEVTTPGWYHEAVDDNIVVPPVKHLRVNDPSPTRPPPPPFSKPVQSLSVVKSTVSSKGKGKVVEQPSAVVSFAPSSSLTMDVVDMLKSCLSAQS
ncbi:hypothetical protein IW261DRAFT_1556860 [Armillaria novae-zelandiae]|uniref:Uncharacterized protein n=1 Tax=Armillaria novae-zelandiae TaxID=153914 RepID=A0AA39PRC9_9AGAR|nr:hypothetical protein IW261DRAFT_1556860 [Armillaria novae-zelandiae]